MTVFAKCHPELKNHARGLCKNCYASIWAKENPEKNREIRRKWIQKHPNLVEASRIRNKEKNKLNTKRWREANRERYEKTNQLWKKKNTKWVSYCHINNQGEIIYIGKTNFLVGRNSLHKGRSKWFLEIARTIVQAWPNEASAMMAESWLIAIHKPIYNKLGLKGDMIPK